MNLEELMQNKENIVNQSNKEILDDNDADKIIVKAILILLTNMRLKTKEMNEVGQDIAQSIQQDGSLTALQAKISEINSIEQEYMVFENELDDAAKDPEIKEKLKEKAILILKTYIED
jgi:hypothetical protein